MAFRYEIRRKRLTPRQAAKATKPQPFHAVEPGRTWAMCGVLGGSGRNAWEAEQGEAVECDRCKRAVKVKEEGGTWP